MTGAAGDPGNPNVINCRIVQSGVSGTVVFTKGVLADTQVTSVGTPPALSGTSPLIVVAGDSLALDCTMTRNAQQWSTTQYQPVPGQPAAHRRHRPVRRPARPFRHHLEAILELISLVEEVAQRPSRGLATGPQTSHGVS